MIYLIELKTRFVLVFLSFVFLFLICYFYKETILFFLIKPYGLYFIFTNVTEVFSVYLELVAFVCIQIMIIYSTYQIFVFISPSLTLKEYVLFYYLFVSVVLFWVLLINILNYLLVPLFCNFFLSFQSLTSVSLYFEAKLNEYLSFYISLYYLSFFYLFIFVFVFFLLYKVNNNVNIIKRLRKIFYFVFVIISTFFSPPDVFSQILISFLNILIYEFLLFIFLARYFIKQVTN